MSVTFAPPFTKWYATARPRLQHHYRDARLTHRAKPPRPHGWFSTQRRDLACIQNVLLQVHHGPLTSREAHRRKIPGDPFCLIEPIRQQQV